MRARERARQRVWAKEPGEAGLLRSATLESLVRPVVAFGRRAGLVAMTTLLVIGCGANVASAPTASDASAVPSTTAADTASSVADASTSVDPSVAAEVLAIGTPNQDPANPSRDAGGAGAPGAATIASTATNVVFTRSIGDGDQGDDVLALQTRLNELHFDVRKPDGYWGLSTKMAVWSYEQLVLRTPRADVTGKVTPEMWERIKKPLALKPWRPNATATHVELFLPEQTLVLWVDGEIRLITHISSGSSELWCAIPRNVPAYVGATTSLPPGGERMRRVCGQSITPGGTFKVYRKEKGWWDIPLGKVYNPMYFNGGIAIHGYDQVPFTPASHGCVRVPMHIAEYLQELLHYDDDVIVFDGVQAPEAYGAQHAPPDQVDPTDSGHGVAPPTTRQPGTTTTRAPLTPDDQPTPPT